MSGRSRKECRPEQKNYKLFERESSQVFRVVTCVDSILPAVKSAPGPDSSSPSPREAGSWLPGGGGQRWRPLGEPGPSSLAGARRAAEMSEILQQGFSHLRLEELPPRLGGRARAAMRRIRCPRDLLGGVGRVKYNRANGMALKIRQQLAGPQPGPGRAGARVVLGGKAG